jgi:hypothetical protein
MNDNDLDTLFYLKPFEWEKKIFEDRQDSELHTTKTWGRYRVERWDFKEWVVSYYYEEHYDEGKKYFDSLEEAKQWCWDDWVERISPYLIKTRI